MHAGSLVEDGRWIMHSHTQQDLFNVWIDTTLLLTGALAVAAVSVTPCNARVKVTWMGATAPAQFTPDALFYGLSEPIVSKPTPAQSGDRRATQRDW